MKIKEKLSCLILGLSLFTGGCVQDQGSADSASNQQDQMQEQQTNQQDGQKPDADSDKDAANPSVMVCSADEADCSNFEEISETSFTPISFDEAVAFFEEGKSGVLYFGFPDCPWCQDVIPVLEQESKSENIPVYYVRTRDDDKNRLYTDEQKEQIIPYIGSYMKDNEEGELTLYVPLVISVVDGQAVDGHEGTIDGHDAKEREMTEEETRQLGEALKTLLETQKTTAQ